MFKKVYFSAISALAFAIVFLLPFCHSEGISMLRNSQNATARFLLNDKKAAKKPKQKLLFIFVKVK